MVQGIREFIRTMSLTDPLWGDPRIHAPCVNSTTRYEGDQILEALNLKTCGSLSNVLSIRRVNRVEGAHRLRRWQEALCGAAES